MDPTKKKFRISGDKIRPLVPAMGGAMASDRTTYPQDSGWNFFAGDEGQEYTDNADNMGIYEVNTICNYDPAIIPYLDFPAGSSLVRIKGEDRSLTPLKPHE